MKLTKIKCDSCGAPLEEKDLKKMHCSFCGAEILIDDDATKLKRIEEAKLESRKQNHEQDLKEKRDFEELNRVENFKKSKFSKVLLVFAAICGLITFTRSFDFCSIISLIQALLFLTSWLMGMQIIKEPVNKLHIILAIIAFALIIPFASIGNNDTTYDTKPINIDISQIELKEKFPEPEELYGRLETNRKDLLMIEICNVEKNEFKDYINKNVQDAGYKVDLEYVDWDNVYGAYDNEGYNIRIIYDNKDKEMHITLSAPEKMENIEWPNTGLGSLLPIPKSLYANISWNNSETFIVHIGNTPLEEYNNYVKECENKGYTIDFSKDKKYFSAKNSDGYELHLRYLGGNIMEISLKSSGDYKEPSNNNDTGLSSSFKQSMDSYEAFIDEYIEFMTKYTASNGSDLELLKDYGTYLQKYTEALNDFEKWEGKDLTEEETNYYLEVQMRINKKLISASLS